VFVKAGLAGHSLFFALVESGEWRLCLLELPREKKVMNIHLKREFPLLKRIFNTKFFSMSFLLFTGTVGRKSHDPCLHVFLVEARVMTIVAHCTCPF